MARQEQSRSSSDSVMKLHLEAVIAIVSTVIVSMATVSLVSIAIVSMATVSLVSIATVSIAVVVSESATQ